MGEGFAHQSSGSSVTGILSIATASVLWGESARLKAYFDGPPYARDWRTNDRPYLFFFGQKKTNQ